MMDAISDIVDKIMPDDYSKLANDKMMNIAEVKGLHEHIHCRLVPPSNYEVAS
jgi:REP element-mobilizing transposase RayT